MSYRIYVYYVEWRYVDLPLMGGGEGVPTTFVTYFSCTAYSFLEKRDRNLHRVTQGCT